LQPIGLSSAPCSSRKCVCSFVWCVVVCSCQRPALGKRGRAGGLVGLIPLWDTPRKRAYSDFCFTKTDGRPRSWPNSPPKQSCCNVGAVNARLIRALENKVQSLLRDGWDLHARLTYLLSLIDAPRCHAYAIFSMIASYQPSPLSPHILSTILFLAAQFRRRHSRGQADISENGDPRFLIAILHVCRLITASLLRAVGASCHAFNGRLAAVGSTFLSLSDVQNPTLIT